LVVGRPRVRRARGAASRVVVVWARVVLSSVARWCGAHTAQLLVSLTSEGKWRGRCSAAGAARWRRCCSCRCQRVASGVVVGRPRVRRARGGAARVVVVWARVVWSSVGRGCGAHTAQLLVSLSSGGKWRGLWSAAGAARRRRCCSCCCRLGASGGIGAAGGQVVWRDRTRQWRRRGRASRAVVGPPRVRRARGGAARVVVVGGQGASSLIGRGCGAQAAVFLVSWSFGRASCGIRSAAGAARTRRYCLCR